MKIDHEQLRGSNQAGCHVYVGVVEYYETNAEGKRGKKQLEVDFVATRGSEKYYIQSAFALATQEKINQEQRGLLRIPDSFRKNCGCGRKYQSPAR